MAIARVKPGHYPAVLSYGFRPFFLLGALQAGLAILFWLPLFYSRLDTSSLFAPVDWHVHEMLFGYLPAVMTGFLLTAIPNWTGRLPVQGVPLLGLVLLWLAGRIAVFFSSEMGWMVAAVIDCDGTAVRANVINVEPDPEHVKLGMKVKLATYSLGADDNGAEAIGFGYEPA